MPPRNYLITEQIYDLLIELGISPLDLMGMLHRSGGNTRRWLGDRDLVIAGHATEANVMIAVHLVESDIDEVFTIVNVRTLD